MTKHFSYHFQPNYAHKTVAFLLLRIPGCTRPEPACCNDEMILQQTLGERSTS